MAENDIEALAAKADRGPWHFDKSTGQIYRRPDHLTKYIIAEMESSNDANGELVVALVNSLTAPLGIAAPERPPIMLDIAAASETDEMWKRRWLALCQMYERDPCFVDSNGKWGLRDFLDYAAEVCGFIASPTALTALRSTTAEPVGDTRPISDVTRRMEKILNQPFVMKAPLEDGVKEHWSSCAVHNEPAYPAGECDCGGFNPSDTSLGIPRHPTDSAAKDAEIAAYREALEALKHEEVVTVHTGYDSNGNFLYTEAVCTDSPAFQKALAALANRGEAGSLAKERGE